MVKMSEKSRAFIEKNLPDVSCAENPKMILKPLYELIMYKGFNAGWDGYNAFGDEAQEVYDDIFDSNLND